MNGLKIALLAGACALAIGLDRARRRLRRHGDQGGQGGDRARRQMGRPDHGADGRQGQEDRVRRRRT